MKRKTFIITFAVFLVISLSVAQVVVSNRLSTAGLAVAKIEDEIRFYKEQNSVLSERILAASSLANLASKAAALGFTEDGEQLVLKSSLPIALKSQ